MNSIRTHERAVAFCAALADTGNVSRACKAVSIGRATAYEWREEDTEFAGMWDRAAKLGLYVLEDEAQRRAVHGVEKVLLHEGRPIVAVEPALDRRGRQKVDKQGELMWKPVLDEKGRATFMTHVTYSDALLTLLLKASDPEKYRERSDLKLGVTGELSDALAEARQRAKSR